MYISYEYIIHTYIQINRHAHTDIHIYIRRCTYIPCIHA